MKRNGTLKNFTFFCCTGRKCSVCTSTIGCCVNMDCFPHTQSFQKFLQPITFQQIYTDVSQKFWFERNDGLEKVFSENRTQGIAGSVVDEKHYSAIMTNTNELCGSKLFFRNVNSRASTCKHCHTTRRRPWYPEEIKTVKIVPWH